MGMGVHDVLWFYKLSIFEFHSLFLQSCGPEFPFERRDQGLASGLSRPPPDPIVGWAVRHFSAIMTMMDETRLLIIGEWSMSVKVKSSGLRAGVNVQRASPAFAQLR
jgi:hypothetical protein